MHFLLQGSSSTRVSQTLQLQHILKITTEIIRKLFCWEVVFQIIQYIKIIKKKNHLIATHSVAVKDSNFLVFFSCHVIQTLICLHISYLGVKKNTLQKVDVFRGEHCPSQTTPAPVLSAIHPEVMWMKHKTSEPYYNERPLSVTQTPKQVFKLPGYRIIFVSSLFPWELSILGTLFAQRLVYNKNGHNRASSLSSHKF